MFTAEKRPLLQIGLVSTAIEASLESSVTTGIRARLEDSLVAQFPDFHWEFETAHSPHHTEEELHDPLHLVETAFREKVARHWDAAILVTDTPIRGNTRPFTVAIPSSALEVGVVSRALFETAEDSEATAVKTAAVIVFLLGSLWGLAPSGEGAMQVPGRLDDIELESFNETQTAWLRERLSEVADARIEEKDAGSSRRNLPAFYLQSLLANPRGIASDVIGYRPWWQPFRLSRLTAAAVVSVVFLFLGAEAWEIGFHLSPGVLLGGTLLSVFISAIAIYSGQNLSEIAPAGALNEQLARTRIVLFLCLLIGMLSLGVVLFTISLAVASVLPEARIETWTGKDPDLEALSRFATFTAMLGVLAGALGGNLEENADLKARFFFDEEI